MQKPTTILKEKIVKVFLEVGRPNTNSQTSVLVHFIAISWLLMKFIVLGFMRDTRQFPWENLQNGYIDCSFHVSAMIICTRDVGLEMLDHKKPLQLPIQAPCLHRQTGLT